MNFKDTYYEKQMKIFFFFKMKILTLKTKRWRKNDNKL